MQPERTYKYSKFQPYTAVKHDNSCNLGAWLMIFISALLCLGALMVFSAGAGVDQEFDLRHFWKYSTLRRVAFVPLVWIILAVVSKFNYRRWVVNMKNFWLSPILYLQILAIILLAVVLIPGIGKEVNYSRRWLVIGSGTYGLQFQPSELAKWVTVMFLAAYSAWQGNKMSSFRWGFLPCCGILLLVVGLIGVEDFGTAALVGAMGVVVMLIGGVRWWHMSLLLPLAAVAFFVLVYSNQYRWARVQAYFNHDSQVARDTGYQARQSMMAVARGGMWGCSLGEGTVKLGHLPEDTTDFVFAVIGEELGFAGCLLTISLFVAILICSMLIVNRTGDLAGKYLGVAIAGTISAQALMNLLVVTGMAPTKGIALPFVSAGGSGLVMTALAAGVLVNVARSGNCPDNDEQETWESQR